MNTYQVTDCHGNRHVVEADTVTTGLGELQNEVHCTVGDVLVAWFAAPIAVVKVAAAKEALEG